MTCAEWDSPAILPDTILGKIDADFQLFEKAQIKARSTEPSMLHMVCPIAQPGLNVVEVPGFFGTWGSNSGLVERQLISKEIGIDTLFEKKEDKALRTKALRFNEAML